jgi:DNA-binding beta-propeller fold protein YncE
LPDEVEGVIDLRLPQASERFVYAANPEGGTVAIIDAETLAIQTLETGARPTFLGTLAGSDDAIVLNVDSEDATIIREPSKGATSSTVDVVRGANAIAVAPDGKHAVVYFDAAQPGAATGSGSFQDVSVLTLEAGNDRAVDMTVGFRPRSVFFAQDGSEAYVVNEDGISVLDLDKIDGQGSGIARLVSLGTGLDQQAADVQVTPDGRRALAREPGSSAVRLVDLDDGEIRKLNLAKVPAVVALQEAQVVPSDDDAGAPVLVPVEVTDLDLSPDGSFVLAVLRSQSAVLRIPVPGGFNDESRIEVIDLAGEIVGSASIAPNSESALVYTTAADIERMTIVDLKGNEPPRTVALRKTVEAVAIAPDGQTALIVHKKANGDPNQAGIDPDLQIDRSFGYSVLRLATGNVKLQVTQVRAGSFTLVPDGSLLFILFRDDPLGLREVQQVDLTSFLVHPFQLGSPPVSLGTVPGSERVFVSQEHADGRITLIDWSSGETRTVTGFELNSRIRD